MNIEVSSSPEDDPDKQFVIECAQKTLQDAGIRGKLPTSATAIMSLKQLKLAGEIDALTDIRAIYPPKFYSSLVEAKRKVRAALIYSLNEIWVAQGLSQEQQLFNVLHECGHAFIPSQAILHSLNILDDARTLEPSTVQLFEKQANIFAAYALFQDDVFCNLANDYKVSLKVPLQLRGRFGASFHSAIRFYVETCPEPCLAVVLTTNLSHQEGKEGRKVLYSLASPHYNSIEPLPKIKDWYPVGHQFCRLCDSKDYFSDRHVTILVTPEGNKKYYYEVFFSTYQHFVMLTPVVKIFSSLHHLPIAL